MKVKLLMDYRGVLSNEIFYSAGEYDDMPDDVAIALIANGRAEEIKPVAKPKRRTTRKKADN